MSDDFIKRGVLFDLDDTLYLTAQNALEVANQKFAQQLNQVDFTIEDWTTYSWLADQIEARFKLDKEEVFDLLYGKEVIPVVQPHDLMVEWLGKLTTAGFEIAVVTSRPPNQRNLTIAAVTQHFPGLITTKNIHVRPEGSQLSGPEFKKKIIEKIEPVAYLDDNPETIKFLAKELGNRITRLILGLLDRTWNRSYSAQGNDHDLDGHRFLTFSEFVNRLNSEHGLGFETT